MTQSKKLLSVPTNIITGFLGVGKTSAILNLLKNKANNERWAVLVNEFGEIGVDGALLESENADHQGVYISEVPGGCMCCAAGVPMQVALNQLLQRARPDRLLIEPTGLGHPNEVMQVLSGDMYRDVLDIQRVLTLVDARKLQDSRYTEHDTFNQQIAIADVVIGNKVDLYEAGDKTELERYVAKHAIKETDVVFAQHGAIDESLLVGKSRYRFESKHHHHHEAASRPDVNELAFPTSGFIKAVNTGEGYVSVGWRVSPTIVFSLQKVRVFVVSIQAERFKALFITDQGIFSYNKAEDGIREMYVDECRESRIEIISETENTEWEAQLIECVA